MDVARLKVYVACIDLYVSIFYETAGLFRAQGFLKKFEILDIHETSTSEIEFYEMSSSETDTAVDHLLLVVVWVAGKKSYMNANLKRCAAPYQKAARWVGKDRTHTATPLLTLHNGLVIRKVDLTGKPFTCYFKDMSYLLDLTAFKHKQKFNSASYKERIDAQTKTSVENLPAGSCKSFSRSRLRVTLLSPWTI